MNGAAFALSLVARTAQRVVYLVSGSAETSDFTCAMSYATPKRLHETALSFGEVAEQPVIRWDEMVSSDIISTFLREGRAVARVASVRPEHINVASEGESASA